MKVIEMLAPAGHACRPGIGLLGFRGITIHNTSNWSNGANAVAHANLLRGSWANVTTSWHYVVDKDYAVRCIPENETAWCAGDGNGDGNRKTINIEICDNADGDIRLATDNTVELCADILRRHGITDVNGHLFQHNYWTGKDCPYDMRRGNPYDWNTFCSKVQEKLNGGNPSTPVGDKSADQILEVGSKVILNGVFNIDEIRGADSKYPNGALGCYDLCYGKPIGDNDWIPCGPIGKVDPTKNRVDYDAVLKVGDKFICDKIFDVKDVEGVTSHCKNGVATIEADGVKFRIDCGPLYEASNK